MTCLAMKTYRVERGIWSMRVLFTGNLGYIGPVAVRHFRQRFPEATLIGYDTGFFAHCLTTNDILPEARLDVQHFGDVRSVPDAVLEGVDTVIHLAAISNDPMGNQFEAATDAINRDASIQIATRARQLGVRRFVFASSCSVYGFAQDGARTETDTLNPLTAYARSKIDTERALETLAGDDFVVTCLRFATACGMSDRLRVDLVLNDFVAAALTSGEITVLSDGSPWRPLIEVRDMARALEWAGMRTIDAGGTFLAINAGSDDWNYRVRDLAEAVAAELPSTKVAINTDAQPDKRSYRVDFARYAHLAPDHQPQVSLPQAIRGLVDGLRAIGFADPDFRHGRLSRLTTLRGLLEREQLDTELAWRR
jgi:nucleoside-diphosphate-sugar epimerase